jgi:hypothetical protein
MNRNILLLMMIGVALAIFHVPELTLTLGIIGGLAIATIRLFWIVLRAFSAPKAHAYVPIRSD